MADQSQPQSSGQASPGLQIPADTEAKFGPLLILIKGSESMNDEERQYWINILPIMTPEQIKNLEEILTSEKEQLKAIDAKYGKQMNTRSDAEVIGSMGHRIRSKKEMREKQEQEDADREKRSEDDILSKIQEL